MQLMGRTIPVNKNAGIFVTLNPAGKGYGGRSKLPDNLKQLFRPVAMSTPDLEQIAETYLFSEGFKEGAKLAVKMVSLFKLCSQLLSAQKHYDWAMRA
jgi:dynein heavy chain 2